MGTQSDSRVCHTTFVSHQGSSSVAKSVDFGWRCVVVESVADWLIMIISRGVLRKVDRSYLVGIQDTNAC